MLAAVLMATGTVAAAAAPAPVSLEVGQWEAHGRTQGTSSFSSPQGNLDLSAEFEFDFTLDVGVDGAATGEWLSVGDVVLAADAAEGSGTLNQGYRGDGIVSTIGEELAFEGRYDWSGTFTTNGFTVAVPAGEMVPDVTLIVDGTTCDEAWGTMALRWEEDFEGAGWEPSFVGTWIGSAADVPDERLDDYLPGLSQLVVDHNEQVVAWSSGQPTQSQVVVAWDFIDRSLELLNELRNLGECAQRLFTPDRLEQWQSVLTTATDNPIRAIALFKEPPVGGYEMLALVDAGLAAGLFGPGSMNTPSGAEAEALLRAGAQQIFDDAVIPDGGLDSAGEPCASSSGCLGPGLDEGAMILSGRLLGWSFDLSDGSTISAAEIERRINAENIDFEDTVRGVELS